MKLITKYQAEDGTEFDNEEDCLQYESIIRIAKSIEVNLPERPVNDGCSFSNGEGYLQHDTEKLWQAKVQILNTFKDYSDHHWIEESLADRSVHPSYVSRILGERRELKPLNDIWRRFCNIDEDGREWGQGYFAANPHKGKQVCLNQSNLF